MSNLKMAMLTLKYGNPKIQQSPLPEELNISVQSLPEAKLKIKTLKLKKKEYALVKRELTQQQKMIRAEYTDKIRQQGSKVRGGGSLGSLVRTLQTGNRDAARRDFAQQLAPLEEQKNTVDAVITAIDQAILQLEKYIVENS